MPLTTPELLPTVATPVLPLVQVPPVGEELSVDVPPIQIPVAPVIAPGAAITDTVWVAKQPLPTV